MADAVSGGPDGAPPAFADEPSFAMKTSSPGLRLFYRLAYGLFLLLAAYQVFLRDDPVSAAGAAGIGLIFDPFNPDQPWGQRPRWQRLWLIAHLALAAGLLGYGIGRADRS